MAKRIKYTVKIADHICKRLSEGESLRAMCKDDDMPCQSTVFKWLAAEPAFAEQYARAREAQADCMADEIQEIADEVANDATAVARNRLRVDARKWLASKMVPKKYGDTLAIGGAENLPPVRLMSNDALETKIAELLAKSREEPK
jgi:hypothetical protein